MAVEGSNTGTGGSSEVLSHSCRNHCYLELGWILALTNQKSVELAVFKMMYRNLMTNMMSMRNLMSMMFLK